MIDNEYIHSKNFAMCFTWILFPSHSQNPGYASGIRLIKIQISRTKQYSPLYLLEDIVLHLNGHFPLPLAGESAGGINNVINTKMSNELN